MLLLPLLLLPLLSSAHELFHWPFLNLSTSTNPSQEDASSYENYFTQAIDHFNANSTSTFQQRYFKNSAYSNSSGVHLLYLEGMGVASPSKVSDETLPHVANGKAIKATLWSLEHRHFGKSRPFSDVSTPNLQLLTTAQTLQDIKAFIDGQNTASGETNPKWILVGGYYGGALALWYQKKYPSSVVGVVASSPYAQPTVNYYQYEKNVEDTYASFDPACYQNMKDSILQVRQAVQSKKGRKRLSSDLKLSPTFSSQSRLTFNRLQFFMGSIMFINALPVQLNKANTPPFNGTDLLSTVCSFYNDQSASDGIAKVVNVVTYVMGALQGGTFTALPNSYDQVVQAVKVTAYDDTGAAVTTRLSLWLELNELGGFPTTDFGGQNAFGSHFPINIWLNLVWDTFGRHVTNITTLELGVNATKNAYGWGSTYQGSNALVVLGGADPWRHMGYSTVQDCSSSVYTIDGGSLMNDMMPPLDGDSSSLKAARALTTQKITSWAASGKTQCTNTGGQGQQQKMSSRANRLTDEKKDEPASVDPFGEIKEWNAEVVHDIGDDELVEKKFFREGSPKSPRNNFLRRNSHSVHLKEKFDRNAARINKPYSIKKGYIVQQIDPFDPTYNDTYKQYFWENSQYDEEAGVFFLMLGGEGPIDWFYVSEYLAYTEWANNYGAFLYSLEHRFYGQSQPFDDVSTPHLKYLRSQYALADAAIFINSINTQQNISSPKWVVFGGSYPGSLSAWFRLKYPQLVVGAVASSAPVQAKVDYYGYLQVVQNSTIYLGPKGCANNVHRFFEWVQKQMTTINGRKAFSDQMWICEWDQPYVLEKDMENAVADIIYFISGDVQYDDEGHDYLYWTCEAFKDLDEDVSADMRKKKELAVGQNISQEEESFDRKARQVLRQLMKRGLNQTRTRMMKEDSGSTSSSSDDDDDDDDDADSWCEPYSYWSLVDYFQQINPYDTSDRCWVYQTCNEIGVFQSSNFGPSIFESTIRVNFYADLCR